MANNSIEPTLDAVETIFEIDLINKATGTTYPQAAVYGTNTLGQILNEYAEDLGINKKHPEIICFENKRTGKTTRNSNETVEGLGLQAGDVLAIRDNCFAGPVPVPIKKHWTKIMQEFNYEFDGDSNNRVTKKEKSRILPLRIDLVNECSGKKYPRILVFNVNLLGNIATEYSDELGLHEDSSKLVYINKRTGAITYCRDAFVKELGLPDGDVLVIRENWELFGNKLPT